MMMRKITLTADDIARLRYEVRHTPGMWVTEHGVLLVHAPQYDVEYEDEYHGEGVDWAYGCPNEFCCPCCGCDCPNEDFYEEEPE